MFRRKPAKTIVVAPAEENNDLRKSLAFSVAVEVSARRKLPSKIVERLNASRRSPNEVAYTDEESVLMAEIMREATLQDIKTKAGKVDHRIFDAGRKRMCFDSLKEQTNKRKEAASARSVPDIRERQRKVKEMAESARKLSAEKRSSSHRH